MAVKSSIKSLNFSWANSLTALPINEFSSSIVPYASTRRWSLSTRPPIMLVFPVSPDFVYNFINHHPFNLVLFLGPLKIPFKYHEAFLSGYFFRHTLLIIMLFIFLNRLYRHFENSPADQFADFCNRSGIRHFIPLLRSGDQ